MEMLCPNCGHTLVPYRKEQQKACTVEVLLEWSICARCRHVALNDWSFKDPIKPPTVAEQKVQRKRKERQTRNPFSPWTAQAQQRA